MQYRQPTVITREQHEQIYKLRKEGLSFRQIGDLMGISHDAAFKWSKRPLGTVAPAVELPVMESPDKVFDLIFKSKRKWSLEEISDKLDIGIGRVRAAILALKDGGKNLAITESSVEVSHSIPPSEPIRIDVSKFKGRRIRFGLTSDNHLGSKYARMEVLEALYDIWEADGITDVYQCGNMIDGDARFNRFDLLVHGMKDQAEYFVENWPRRDGMHLHFITGDDHEGWYVQREGVDIGEYLQHVAQQNGRTDMHYLGHMEQDVIFKAKNGHSTMRLLHAGGGSAYATSYTAQKIVESYQGGEKPNILLIGHYHKAEYGYPREVHCVQAGCTEDQTPFMRKLKIQAHVGGWTVEFDLDDNGIIHDFTTKWHPFYDRAFYENPQWGYQWKSRLEELPSRSSRSTQASQRRSRKSV
jgi:hypothetical protein